MVVTDLESLCVCVYSQWFNVYTKLSGLLIHYMVGTYIILQLPMTAARNVVTCIVCVCVRTVRYVSLLSV